MTKNTEMTALSKLISSKDAKASLGELSDGNYEVDFNIHVFGTLDINTSDKASSCSIPYLKALALCLHYSGCQRENLLPVLKKSIEHAMKADKEEIAELLGMEWKDLAGMEKRVKDEVVAKLPRTIVRRTNAKLNFNNIMEEIEDTLLKTA